jgi:hypothetical protein
MTPAWWAAFGPAETTISCGSGHHLVRWVDGSLQAADHPDAEGELVLAALGGDATPCLDLVQAWGARSDDLTVLAIGPRSARDKLTVTPTVLEELGGGPGGSGWFAYSPGTGAAFTTSRHGRIMRGHSSARLVATTRASAGSRGGVIRSSGGFWSGHRPRGPHSHPRHWAGMDEEPQRGQLLALLALGAPFQWRLSGAVAHAWSADGQHAGDAGRSRPALTAALASRVAPAAAQWLGIEPERVEVSIHDQDGWGEVSVDAHGLRAKLPVSWLARVWAAGLAVVGTHLIVDVEEAAWPQARVLALAAGRKPVELTVRNDGREWSVVR